MKLFFRLLGALIALVLLAPILFSDSRARAHPPVQGPPFPKFNLKDPCPRDPNNLIFNGTMRDEHSFQFGSLADGWDAFIYSGAPPAFRRVDNEGIDGTDSQQIFSTNTFDAGIFQTVRNLQPGTYYLFRVGYSLAAKSFGGGNQRVDSIGRQVGVDPTGGTDAHSANIIWGPEYFNGIGALNLPEMTMIFSARADRATIFLRALARDGSGGENRVWFDAVCMEARPEIPPATLAPPPTATSAAPTARPTATRISATRAPAITFTRTTTPTKTKTPTPRASATATAPPLRARPQASESNDFIFQFAPDMLTGLGIVSMFGSFFFFGLGFVTLKK